VAATIRSGNGRESLSTVRSNHVRLLQVIAPVIAMGAVLAAPAVAILYRRQYWEVGKLVSCLLIGTWLGAINSSYGSVLMAAGRPKYLSVGSVVKAVTFLALVFFIAPRFGVVGVAIWLGISEIGSLVIAVLGWRGVGLSAWKSDVVITLLALAYTAVCQLVYESSLRLLHGASVAAMLVVVAMTGGVVWILGRRSKLF
jgi:O-antigen/teichoic acid export membrane protein